jgi:hypothetical protein
MKMFIMKMYNIKWERDGMYIIREQRGRFGYSDLMKVRVYHLFEKCIEFEKLPAPLVGKSDKLLLKKSDFGIWGTWEMIEQY